MTRRTSSGVRLVGALPGLAEQPRLVVGRERRRLADVDVGRLRAAAIVATMASTTLRARHDEQAHRTAQPLGDRRDWRRTAAAPARSVRGRASPAALSTSGSSTRTVITTTSRSPAACSAAATWSSACGLRTGTRTQPGRVASCAGDTWSSLTTSNAAGASSSAVSGSTGRPAVSTSSPMTASSEAAATAGASPAASAASGAPASTTPVATRPTGTASSADRQRHPVRRVLVRACADGRAPRS